MAGERTGAEGPADRGPGDGLRDATRATIDTVKQEAGDLASRATEQGKSMLSRQKDAAADHVDSVARALQGSARGLEREEPAAGRYVGYAAERLESVGRRLRERDVDGLIDDVQDMGRRAPGAFFAGSVVAGFLMARFLKSSADRASGPGHWRDASSTVGERDRPRGMAPEDGGHDLRGRSAGPTGGTDLSAGMATSSGPGATAARASTSLGADGTPGTRAGTSPPGSSATGTGGASPAEPVIGMPGAGSPGSSPLGTSGVRHDR
ncbi:MAG: hypothetical protein EHM87_15810 [Burkholderiales bacterium]|nr:MAG: hypothetical protein EHM87_15810 [Burkholderiales bacterium]